MAAAVPFAAAAFQAAGSIFSGYSQSGNLKAQARVGEQNAQTADAFARNAQLEASANEDAQRRKSAGDMSRQTAALAENGIGLDSATAQDVTYQSALNSELDALNIRYAGQLKANQLYGEAANFRNEAAAARAGAKQAVIGGWLGAGASALSGYGSYLKGQAGTVRSKAGQPGTN